MAKKNCYSPTCSSCLNRIQDRCYSATCPDIERKLLADADRKDKIQLLDLRDGQFQVMDQLESLQTKMENLKNTVRSDINDEATLKRLQECPTTTPKKFRDLVVKASPRNPPLSLFALVPLLRRRFRVAAFVHAHSSVGSVDVALREAFGDQAACESRGNYELVVTLIWKETPFDRPQLVVDNKNAIIGEVNIARYFRRLLSPGPSSEDLSSAVPASLADALLDAVSNLLDGAGSSKGAKERAALVKSVASSLSLRKWLGAAGGDDDSAGPGVEDVVVWPYLASVLDEIVSLPRVVEDWMRRCNEAQVCLQVKKFLR